MGGVAPPPTPHLPPVALHPGYTTVSSCILLSMTWIFFFFSFHLNVFFSSERWFSTNTNTNTFMTCSWPMSFIVRIYIFILTHLPELCLYTTPQTQAMQLIHMVPLMPPLSPSPCCCTRCTHTLVNKPFCEVEHVLL